MKTRGMARWRRGALLSAASVIALVACSDAPAPDPAAVEPDVPASAASAGEPDSDDRGAPVFESIRFEPSVLAEGRPVKAVARAVDPEGAPVYFSYRWTLNGKPFPDGDAIARFPRLTRGDVVEVWVEASDPSGARSEEHARIVMGNRPPRIVGIDLENDTDESGGAIWKARGSAEDPDGDRVAFETRWLVNGAIEATGDEFSKKGLKRGDTVRVRMTANDGDLESEPLDSAPVEIGNKPPDILSTPPGLDPSGKFVYEVEARDPDGDRALRYALAKGPEGMTIGQFDGVVQWTPSFDEAGEHAVEVSVDDRNGGVTKQRFTLSVRVIEEEAAPPASP